MQAGESAQRLFFALWPDPALRRQEIEKEKQWIRMSAELGAKYCRVLSGQRRPQLLERAHGHLPQRPRARA